MMTLAEAEALVTTIPERRAAHCRRVGDTAAGFAPRWPVAPDKVRLAGLLHDFCRDWSDARIMAAAKLQGLEPSPLELANPAKLLHGPVAAGELADRDLPSDVLEAISIHTCGGAGMSPLARCVYLADFCEPGREYADATAVRELAATSLDEALGLSVRLRLQNLLSRGRTLMQGTVDLYNETHSQ